MRVNFILRTGLINGLFQIVFLAAMYVLGRSSSLNTGQTARLVILAALAFIPCIIWTLFFYLQDRHEPEPPSHIITPFIAGMAASGLGAIPLIHILFRSQEWIYSSIPLFVAGSFIVKAFVVSSLFYLVLRYGFLPLREFNEPVDGLIYGAIVGTGFAFVYSLKYLAAHPSFTLYVIAFTATVNVLIFSSVGALMGYILSLAKFQKKNMKAKSILSVTLGILLLGIFYLFGEFFFVSGIEHAFWLCFASVLVYSLLILGYCYFMMRRLSKKGVYKGAMPKFRFDSVTAVFILILLAAAGIVSHQGLLGKKFTNEEYGFSFRHPHSLSTFTLFRFYQPLTASDLAYKTLFSGNNESPSFSFSVNVDERGDPHKEIDSLRYRGAVRTESFLVGEIDIGGKKGRRIAYSFLEKRKDKDAQFPRLIKVFTDIIPVDNGLIVFSYKTDSTHFEDGLPLYNTILSSLKWQR